jgi:hypothetical protein
MGIDSKGGADSSQILASGTGVVDKVFGPCRLAGLLTGRVHLTGTSGTLVGGYP